MVVFPAQHNLKPSIWGCRLVLGNENYQVNIRDNLVYISHLESGLGLARPRYILGKLITNTLSEDGRVSRPT